MRDKVRKIIQVIMFLKKRTPTKENTFNQINHFFYDLKKLENKRKGYRHNGDGFSLSHVFSNSKKNVYKLVYFDHFIYMYTIYIFN